MYLITFGKKGLWKAPAMSCSLRMAQLLPYLNGRKKDQVAQQEKTIIKSQLATHYNTKCVNSMKLQCSQRFIFNFDALLLFFICREEKKKFLLKFC